MKIALYQGRGHGRLYALPGARPEEELEELLGGETEMMPINGKLTLVTRKDGEEEQLPILHTLHRLDREPEPIAGDCAVVAVGRGGQLRDMTEQGLAAADSYIRMI